MKKKIRLIVSGGGTAGHIYPAISIVKEFENRVGVDNCEVLFVGATGKMEERIVPQEGYNIETLPITGVSRRSILQNIKTVINLIKSSSKAKKIVKEFKPDVIVGFGGYASYPIIMAGKSVGIPLYTWEGNSFAGLANKLVNRYVKRAFVAFNNMERFFGDKTMLSGNPIRSTFSSVERKSPEALQFFGFDRDQKVLFVTGGSLGAGRINEAIMANLDLIIARQDIAVIWQTGKFYYDRITEQLKDRELKNVWIAPFISNMSYAYSVTDLIACRSGASTVAEVAQCSLPAIFIPSSGVTDDHQTKNAQSLVDNSAARMLRDSEIVDRLIVDAIELLDNDKEREELSKKIGTFARPDSAAIIVDTILKDCQYE